MKMILTVVFSVFGMFMIKDGVGIPDDNGFFYSLLEKKEKLDRWDMTQLS